MTSNTSKIKTFGSGKYIMVTASTGGGRTREELISEAERVAGTYKGQASVRYGGDPSGGTRIVYPKSGGYEVWLRLTPDGERVYRELEERSKASKYHGKHGALLDVIEEEIDVLEDDDETPNSRKINVDALRRAYSKIYNSNFTFTPTEQSAVRDALEDVGNLYRFAGTSAGYDVEGGESESQMQKRGRNAWLQAGTLGLAYGAINPKTGEKYVTINRKDLNIRKKETKRKRVEHKYGGSTMISPRL